MISLLSKIFENQIIVANTRHPPPRHSRESGNPGSEIQPHVFWIPAFAGMTKSGYRVKEKPFPLSSLAFETQIIRFWTRVIFC